MADKIQKKRLEEIIRKEPNNLTQNEWVKLICTHCQFYHPDEKEKLECAGFKILKKMALNGDISLRQILETVKGISFKEKE